MTAKSSVRSRSFLEAEVLRLTGQVIGLEEQFESYRREYKGLDLLAAELRHDLDSVFADEACDGWTLARVKEMPAIKKLYGIVSNPATSSEADGRRLASDLPDASDPASVADQSLHGEESVNQGGASLSPGPAPPASSPASEPSEDRDLEYDAPPWGPGPTSNQERKP